MKVNELIAILKKVPKELDVRVINPNDNTLWAIEVVEFLPESNAVLVWVKE